MTTAAANGTARPAWEVAKGRAEAEQSARREAARPAAEAFDARAKSIRSGGPKDAFTLVADFIAARHDFLETGPGQVAIRKLYREAWFALASHLYAAGGPVGGYQFSVEKMAILRPDGEECAP